LFYLIFFLSYLILPHNIDQTSLLHSETLEKANHSTIVQLFDRVLTILWHNPTGIRHDKILFLSDATLYN